MKEELVSLEIAELAKEKGFDSAPTQSLLQKWLREKHNYHIKIVCSIVYFVEVWAGYTEQEVQDQFINAIKTDNEFGIQRGIEGGSSSVCMWSKNMPFETYEAALEAGLVEALKLINIK